MADLYRRKEIKMPFPPPPFWKLLGIEVTEMGEGYAKLVMPFDERLTQPYGLIHGGALFSIADSAAAVAIGSVVEPERKFVTIEMKINFLLPVKDGIMEAEARIIRKGKRIIPVDIDISNKERLIAKATATYIILDDDKRL
ncbi:MAG: PaaI family thioesterase [Candidatus Dadabacteria bacterium]